MRRSPTLQRRTASALNSALNDLRFRAIWEHSYRTGVRLLVSTETGRISGPYRVGERHALVSGAVACHTGPCTAS